MSKFRLILFLILPLTLFFACKPLSNEVTPEGAKQVLQLRGYEISAKGYFKAIQADDLAAIRTFFQAEIDPNTLNEKGETPLTFAVVCCEIKTVRALLEKADIDRRNSQNNTPLYLALREDRKDVFDLLLEKNADVKIPGRNNRTVLHLAAAHDDLNTARKLIERGADVNAVDSEGDIPFIDSCIGNPQMEMIGLFLDKGAQVNYQGKNKATCLMYVATVGRVEIIQELLRRGADPKLKDHKGKTALDRALEKNRKEAAALLKGK